MDEALRFLKSRPCGYYPDDHSQVTGSIFTNIWSLLCRCNNSLFLGKLDETQNDKA